MQNQQETLNGLLKIINDAFIDINIPQIKTLPVSVLIKTDDQVTYTVDDEALGEVLVDWVKTNYITASNKRNYIANILTTFDHELKTELIIDMMTSQYTTSDEALNTVVVYYVESVVLETIHTNTVLSIILTGNTK